MPEQTFLCLGAGEAATGISDLLVNAMVEAGVEPKRPHAGAAGWSTRRAWWSRAAANSPNTSGLTRTSCAGERLSRRREGIAAHGHHRRRRRPGHVHERSRARDVAHQRTPDHLRAVEPDVEVRVHRAAGLRLVGRPRAVRFGQPVRCGDARRRTSFRATAGQQLVHLPGMSVWRRRRRRHARHRRDVPDRRAHARAVHDAGRPRPGQPLSRRSAPCATCPRRSPSTSRRSPCATGSPRSNGPTTSAKPSARRCTTRAIERGGPVCLERRRRAPYCAPPPT